MKQRNRFCNRPKPAYRIVPWTLCGMFAFVATAQAQDQPNTAPPNQKPLDPKVGAILDEMESAGQSINSIRCEVKLHEQDNLNLTETTKYGSILFKRAEPHAMFLVEFDRMEADGIVHRHKQWWLFKNRWLTEAKAQSKTIIKRETVGKDEVIDLFDLEKAPFPIPFGQKRETIERNFNVSLTAPIVNDPKDCDHLVCRPKPGAPLAAEYSRLDFLVSRELHLPVKIIAEDAQGDNVLIADFTGLSKTDLNPNLPDSVFVLPPETRDFAVNVEPRN